MPIVMKLKVERSCPMVVCDICHQEIEDARDGIAQWMMGEEGQGDGATLYFTHKRCCPAFDTAAHADRKCPGAQELAHFMVFLSNNIRLDWAKAKRCAELIASID
jgi:hypothetical protein